MESTTVKTETLKLRANGRLAEFHEIKLKLEKLKAGQSELVTVPKGWDASSFRNGLGVKIRYHKPATPKGCYFKTALTEDEKAVAILCVEGTPAPKGNRGRKPGVKNKKAAKK